MPKICGTCGGLGRDCCHILPQDDLTYRPALTLADVARIRQFTKKPPKNFLAVEEVPQPVVDAIQAKVPTFALAYSHNLRIVVDVSKTLSCPLLGKDGCTLPPDVRPRVCSLFPLWYHAPEGDQMSLLPFALSNGERCMAIQGCDQQPAELVSRLEMSFDDLARWAGLSYREGLDHASRSEEEIRGCLK